MRDDVYWFWLPINSCVCQNVLVWVDADATIFAEKCLISFAFWCDILRCFVLAISAHFSTLAFRFVGSNPILADCASATGSSNVYVFKPHFEDAWDFADVADAISHLLSTVKYFGIQIKNSKGFVRTKPYMLCSSHIYIHISEFFSCAFFPEINEHLFLYKVVFSV